MINLTRRQVFWLGVAVGTIAVIFLVLVLLSWLQPAPSVQTALGKLNSTQADHATRIAGLDTIAEELLSTLTAEPPRESCVLVAMERTNTHIFPGGGGCSSLDEGDRVQVAVRTADGFWGYDPDQAGNTNLFRYLWVLKSNAVRLEGDCAAVPVVVAPITEGKYAISKGVIPVYQTAYFGSPILLTLQKGDYAMIVDETREQWMVNLEVSNLTEGHGIGWVDQATTHVEFVVDGCG